MLLNQPSGIFYPPTSKSVKKRISRDCRKSTYERLAQSIVNKETVKWAILPFGLYIKPQSKTVSFRATLKNDVNSPNGSICYIIRSCLRFNHIYLPKIISKMISIGIIGAMRKTQLFNGNRNCTAYFAFRNFYRTNGNNV